MYKLKDWPLFYILPNRLGERCESSQGSWSSQRMNKKRKDSHAPVFVYIRATAWKIIHITRVVLAFNRRSVTHAKNRSTAPHVVVIMRAFPHQRQSYWFRQIFCYHQHFTSADGLLRLDKIWPRWTNLLTHRRQNLFRFKLWRID